MRISLLMTVFFLGAAVMERPAMAGERLNRAGRWMGFGWSDGYHACQSSGHDRSRALPPESYPAYLAGLQPHVAGELLVQGGRCKEPHCGGHSGAFHGGDGPLVSPRHPQVDADSLKTPLGSTWGLSVISDDFETAPGRSDEDAQQTSPSDFLPPSLDGQRPKSEQRELLPPPMPAADADGSAASGSVQPYSAVIHDWIAMPIDAGQPTRLPKPAPRQVGR